MSRGPRPSCPKARVRAPWGLVQDRTPARLRTLLRSRARARLWEAGMVDDRLARAGTWPRGPSPLKTGAPEPLPAVCLPVASADVKYRERACTWYCATSGCHRAPGECQCQPGSQSSPPVPASANGATGRHTRPQLRPGCPGLGYLNLPMARSGDLGDSGKCSPTGLASAEPPSQRPSGGPLTLPLL